MAKCNHTKENSWWLHDARGIPVGRVCESCIDEVEAKFRPDIFTDSNYYADEAIDEEY